jgi:hypothetical protein
MSVVLIIKKYSSSQLVMNLRITFGGMCMLPQHRGGACFCTRGAVQRYDVVLFVLALAKTVTPGGGPRREPGQAAPPTT